MLLVVVLVLILGTHPVHACGLRGPSLTDTATGIEKQQEKIGGKKDDRTLQSINTDGSSTVVGVPGGGGGGGGMMRGTVTGSGIGIGSVQPTVRPTTGVFPVGDPSTLAPPFVRPPPTGNTMTYTISCYNPN